MEASSKKDFFLSFLHATITRRKGLPPVKLHCSSARSSISSPFCSYQKLGALSDLKCTCLRAPASPCQQKITIELSHLLSDLSGGWKARAIDPGHISIAHPRDTQHFSEGGCISVLMCGLESREGAFGFVLRRIQIRPLLFCSCMKTCISLS